jgi:hypothetical protein
MFIFSIYIAVFALGGAVAGQFIPGSDSWINRAVVGAGAGVFTAVAWPLLLFGAVGEIAFS